MAGAPRVLSSVSSGTLMTVLECWIRGTSQSTSCSVLLNGWNASIKVPSVEACSPLPFLDLALEKRVLDERNRKFGVQVLHISQEA